MLQWKTSFNFKATEKVETKCWLVFAFTFYNDAK